MVEPKWMDEAKKHIGLREVKGPEHAPEILAMWRDARLGGIKDDETPWCAGFACACLERVGIRSPRSAAARSFASWGVQLKEPSYGCVAVFTRDGGGHVGFVVGKDAGSLRVLGGNQSDSVRVSPYPMSRLICLRWPPGVPLPTEAL